MNTSEVNMAEETKGGGQSTMGNAVIIIGALLVFALVLGGFGFVKYRVGAASIDWPTVEGRITTARLDTESHRYQAVLISPELAMGTLDVKMEEHGGGTPVSQSICPGPSPVCHRSCSMTFGHLSI